MLIYYYALMLELNMEKISSRRNPLSLHLKKLGVSRSYREASGEFLCDGIKLLAEAVASNAEIVAFLTAIPLPFTLPGATSVYYAEETLIDSLSPLKNAQSILFSSKIPNTESIDTSGQIIILDGVQDPGNVGTVIRTANALSIGSVILTGECADPYNPKSVRASMGAVFRQKFCHMSLTELKTHHESGMRIIGASPGEGSLDICKADLTHSAVAIGSEGGGLSGGVLSLCDEMIAIQIAPECESLNAAVAAAIIMWEMSRRGLR